MVARPAMRKLSDRAYETLSATIRERKLKAGEPVVEQHLAEVLGLSRTPLRHALQRLELEGLLIKAGGRSYQVRKVSIGEYLQSLRVREILEPEAALQSIGRVSQAAIDAARDALRSMARKVPYDMVEHWKSDDAVHDLFINNCGNAVMTSTLHALRVTTQLFEIDRLTDRLDPDSFEHIAILDAIQNGDGKQAKRAVATHIRSLIKFAIDTIS